MTSHPAQHPDPASLSFEDALTQLEQIIERIESGEVGLEQALAEYERGVGLMKRCRSVLAAAELRVEELTAQMKAAGNAAGQDKPGSASR